MSCLNPSCCSAATPDPIMICTRLGRASGNPGTLVNTEPPCCKHIRRSRQRKYRGRRIFDTGKPVLRPASPTKNAPSLSAGAFFRVCRQRRRPANWMLLAAGFPTTGWHPARIEVAPRLMHVATQLAALFGRQAIAAAGRHDIARGELLGPLSGGHHPLRAVAVPFLRRTLRLLCRRARSQKPQDARHGRPSRLAFCRHSRTFIVVNEGYCKPARPQCGWRPSGGPCLPAVLRPTTPARLPEPC